MRDISRIDKEREYLTASVAKQPVLESPTGIQAVDLPWYFALPRENLARGECNHPVAYRRKILRVEVEDRGIKNDRTQWTMHTLIRGTVSPTVPEVCAYHTSLFSLTGTLQRSTRNRRSTDSGAQPICGPR